MSAEMFMHVELAAMGGGGVVVGVALKALFDALSRPRRAERQREVRRARRALRRQVRRLEREASRG